MKDEIANSLKMDLSIRKEISPREVLLCRLGIIDEMRVSKMAGSKFLYLQFPPFNHKSQPKGVDRIRKCSHYQKCPCYAPCHALPFPYVR